MLSFVDMPMREVRRNDLVFASDSEGVRGAWNRVLRVTVHSWGAVRADFADGTHIFQDAARSVHVRRFRVVRGGKA